MTQSQLFCLTKSRKKTVCFHFNREWRSSLVRVFLLFSICRHVSPFSFVFYKAKTSSLEKSVKNYRICRGLFNKLIKCLNSLVPQQIYSVLIQRLKFGLRECHIHYLVMILIRLSCGVEVER